MTSTFDVVLGLDVGKTAHHGCALTATGERLYDKALPQDETALRTVIEQLQTHGDVLVVVDQPNTIGALPIAVARACGATVAYLPGLAMRKLLTCIRVGRRPMLEMLSSLLTRRAPCRVRCGQ